MSDGCFRLLVDGEVVLPSDEFIDDDCVRWLPAERWTIGRSWHNGKPPMRRKIGATGADGATVLHWQIVGAGPNA